MGDFLTEPGQFPGGSGYFHSTGGQFLHAGVQFLRRSGQFTADGNDFVLFFNRLCRRDTADHRVAILERHGAGDISRAIGRFFAGDDLGYILSGLQAIQTYFSFDRVANLVFEIEGAGGDIGDILAVPDHGDADVTCDHVIKIGRQFCNHFQ